MITVALAKGRLANESAELFEKCGIDASVVFSDTRKLVLESADKKFSFFLVKPSDVPTYVEYGIADMGIVGKDTLLEHEKDLYEMLDLKFEPCKLCVATKYVHTARKLYAGRGEDVEIIPLNGSIELAPVTGLSDVIFDVVQTGSTLRANGLVVLEEVFDVSARLVVNKVSLKRKADVILPIIDRMKAIVG